MVDRWIVESVNRWIGSPLLLEQRERKEGCPDERKRCLDGVVFVFRTYSGYPFQVLGCCAPCGLSTTIRGMAEQHNSDHKQNETLDHPVLTIQLYGRLF